jgi:hypothetical protein
MLQLNAVPGILGRADRGTLPTKKFVPTQQTIPQPNMKQEIYWCPVTGWYYDPFRAIRLLHSESQGKVNEWMKGRDEPETYAKLVKLGRSVFLMPEINPSTGQGFLDPTVVKTMDAFAEYCTGKANGVETYSPLWSATVSRQVSAPKNCLDCP